MMGKEMMAVMGLAAQALALNFASVYQQNGYTGPAVCVRPEGGYLLAMGEVSAGYSLSLLWLDDTGAVQQAMGYNNLGAPVDILPVSGGYLVIGDATAGKYVLKVNSLGAVQWAVAHPGLYEITCVTETSDGNILVGGTAYPNSRKRPALWKINGSTGATLWDLYYWNEGTSGDAFALNGVCDFPLNNAYYAVIVRTKPLNPPDFEVYPALLEVRPSDGGANLIYLDGAMSTDWLITPAGILVVPGQKPGDEMVWASWSASVYAGRSDRYHLWFSSTSAPPVAVNYLSYYPLPGLVPSGPIKTSPDTTSFYVTLTSPVVLKLDAWGEPLWQVSMSGYTSDGRLSVATNGDPVLTYLSSGYTYPVMLARLDGADGEVCISTSTNPPSSSPVSGTFTSVPSIQSYDLGTPTGLSVAQVSLSPILDRVCAPTYEKEQERYLSDGTEMRVWATRNQLNVEITLPSGKPVSLSVFDAAGRCRANLWNGPLSAGSHRFVTNLKPGIYTIIARTPASSLMKTAAVSR